MSASLRAHFKGPELISGIYNVAFLILEVFRLTISETLCLLSTRLRSVRITTIEINSPFSHVIPIYTSYMEVSRFARRLPPEQGGRVPARLGVPISTRGGGT